ncbi:MAG: hypothetical protein NUW01_12125 [Gemmatimonadaceae bacterium]|nr:hypothetical protein [Gemmatimonadaceae bacterium]
MTPSVGEVHQQAFYVAADAGYEQAMGSYEDALELVADAKATLFEAREKLRDIEAEYVVNGGHAQWTVSPGMTEKKRELVVRVGLKNWPDYQAARKTLTTAERELDRAEARRDTAANRMALYRRRMDAFLAASNQRAAVLSAHTEGIKPRRN